MTLWHPEPKPLAFGKDRPVPDRSANLVSKTLFSWLTPMLLVGWSRTLQTDDLWEMDQPRKATHLGDAVEGTFYSRCPPKKRPRFIRQRERTGTGTGAGDEKSVVDEKGSTKNTARSSDSDTLDPRSPSDKKGQATTPPLAPELLNAAADSSSVQRTVQIAEEAGDAMPALAENLERQPVGGPQLGGGEGAGLNWWSRVRGEREGQLGGVRAGMKRANARHGIKRPKAKYDESLVKALNRVFFWRFWLSGLLKFVGDSLQTTSPLVTKALLTYLGQAYAYHIAPGLAPVPPSAGRGWGLAVGLWAMQQVSSLATNQFFFQAMQTGFMVRTSVISCIFRKALRLSARSRIKHSSGQITTMISADCTRLDFAAGFFHTAWIGPIQIIVAIALLIDNLGVSALVGLGVLIFGIPVQAVIVSRMIGARRAAVKITDVRVRLMQEVFNGIKLIVLFEWRTPYVERIVGLRKNELVHVRKLALYRAFTFSIVYFIPVLAAVLSFITYSLLGHSLNPAIIFSSLQYLNIVRMPLVMVPLVASSLGDAYVALGRISKVLLAEEIGDDYPIEGDSDWAVQMRGEFTWESAGPPSQGPQGGKGKGKGKGPGKGKDGVPENKEEAKKKKAEAKLKKKTEKMDAKAEKRKWQERRKRYEAGEEVESDDEAQKPQLQESEAQPFRLRDVDFNVPKGAFVAICGKVGSGKSSLLQAMAGEMRKVRGEATFGGTVGYVAQAPWIQNMTLRQNVVFGQQDEPHRFEQVVEACALRQDIEMLPDGEATEIGERGVNLSGGQKARVSLARAAYYDADVVLLDDPLSAVDSHVSRHILQKCLLSGPMADKTRILVTHQLHVLPSTDYVYFMKDGRIHEAGTYSELLAAGGSFAALVEEHGAEEEIDAEDPTAVKQDTQIPSKADGSPKEKGAALMTEEERNEGAVEAEVYLKYLRAAGSMWWAPFLILLLTLMQVSQVGSNILLGKWSAESIPGWSQGQYMGLYAGFGAAQAIFSFAGSFAFSYLGFYSSLKLFRIALDGVLNSSLAFHDTTPVGRIVNRLSKDVDTLDFQLPSNLYQFASQFSTVLGTVGLVIYSYHWLGLMFPPLFVVYYFIQSFYRRTSREAKRLDSILRSALYASYTETLNGLATVRAFREQGRFVRVTEHNVDVNNRAYFLTIACQRWLSIRMDFLGNILILGIGLAAVGFRNSTNPATLGVVLTYSLSITQSLSQIVQQLAQIEQDANVVERLLHFADLPREGSPVNDSDPAVDTWPSRGAIDFKDVELRYRPGLPLVVKGVSFQINAGERVGIVGRTGSGKSSLLAALFRTAELSGGKITIDGVDISQVGLETLRHRISIIPQDAVLFDGTLRYNISPNDEATDAQMYDALRQVGLIGQEDEGDKKDSNDGDDAAKTNPNSISEKDSKGRFNLDSECRDDSYSAGQKQLIALTRAIVKNSRIIVLDEATASVDVQTDAKVQHMIQTTFADRTLLCIAHRLNTVVFYDRILVMDAGQVAEFDTPLNLFDRPGGSIFRSMCDTASLTRDDIIRIRSVADRSGADAAVKLAAAVEAEGVAEALSEAKVEARAEAEGNA